MLEDNDIKAEALKTVLESSQDILQLNTEPKLNRLEYAQAAADGFTKAFTVTTVSAALIAELIMEKIKEREK